MEKLIYILQTYSGMLLESLGQTMLLTLLSLIFAFIIGLIFGLMNVGKKQSFKFYRNILC